jgi:hypothetical protein
MMDGRSASEFNVIRLNGITVEFQGRGELVAFGEKVILRFCEPEPVDATNADERKGIPCIDRLIESLRKMYITDRMRCDLETASTRREAAKWLQFARTELLGLDPYASENKLPDWDKD